MNWGFLPSVYLIVWNVIMFLIADSKVGKKIESIQEFSGLLTVAILGAIGFSFVYALG